MNTRKSHPLKTYRRFEEDLWGLIGLSNKGSKTLTYLFNVHSKDFKSRKLLKNKQFFLNKKNFDFLYRIDKVESQFRRKKTTLKSKNYVNKLKLRQFYGGIKQKQFKNLFKDMNLNVLGSSFALMLETRLDVILYRANFFKSIYSARQSINHKKILVNGNVVNKQSYKVNVGDIISFKPNKEAQQTRYNEFATRLKENKILTNYPSYLEVDYKLGAIMLIKLPKIEEVPYPFEIDLSLLAHNYSK